jgi:hypothetical protein
MLIEYRTYFSPVKASIEVVAAESIQQNLCGVSVTTADPEKNVVFI